MADSDQAPASHWLDIISQPNAELSNAGAALADVNGDGRVELAAIHRSGHALRLFRGSSESILTLKNFIC
jgi:hypothetical protein